jgi:uncharacterized membrane protein required for colicin V production
VRTILSLVAVAVGIVLAHLYAPQVAQWLAKYIPWTGAMLQNIAFFVVLGVVERVLNFIFWILDKTVGFMWRLPFINSLNRLLGMVFGLVEGVVVIGVVLAYLIAHPTGAWIVGQLGTSTIVPILAPVGALLLPGVSGITEMLNNLQPELKQQIEDQIQHQVGEQVRAGIIDQVRTVVSSSLR